MTKKPATLSGMLTHIKVKSIMTFEVHYPASAETGYYSNSRDERYPYATPEQLERRRLRLEREMIGAKQKA